MAQLAMPDSSISTATKAGLVPLQGHTTCISQHPGRATDLCLRNYPQFKKSEWSIRQSRHQASADLRERY